MRKKIIKEDMIELQEMCSLGELRPHQSSSGYILQALRSPARKSKPFTIISLPTTSEVQAQSVSACDSSISDYVFVNSGTITPASGFSTSDDERINQWEQERENREQLVTNSLLEHKDELGELRSHWLRYINDHSPEGNPGHHSFNPSGSKQGGAASLIADYNDLFNDPTLKLKIAKDREEEISRSLSSLSF